MPPFVLAATAAAATAVAVSTQAPPADAAAPSTPSSTPDASPMPPAELSTASSADLDAPRRFRSGVVVGLSLGAGLGGASGYPNASSDIGNPTFYSASGLMTGSSGTFFVMGALSDYLSFGFWLGSAMYRNGDWRSNGGAGGLRVEAFPLVGLVPSLAGLGILGNFGIGAGNLQSTNPARAESNGTQAYIGAGAFYEFPFGHLFGGHFGVGPNLEYDAMWSQPFERHGLVASLRIVFYGGP